MSISTPSGYDIIGDIHGHGDELLALLKKLGYVHNGLCHVSLEGRQALFLGDFIDRGPQQRVVLETVMAMVDEGAARAVMGNHEFNALAFHTPDPDRPGSWLRPRNDKNIGQHIAFLKEYLGTKEDLACVLDWFKQLPLWLEIPDGPRLVHACWHEDEMAAIRPRCNKNTTLTQELLIESSREGTEAYRVVEVLLKGLELPIQGGFLDKDGTHRSEARTRWWMNGATGLHQIALPHGVVDPSSNIALDKGAIPGYHPGNSPVFVGHYWWKGNPEPLEDNVACLDYSVAKGGVLVAYRWSGPGKLSVDNFVSVPSIAK